MPRSATTPPPDLDHRTAIVTGASNGVGAAVATSLAEAGANVVLAVRDPAKGEQVAKGIAGSTAVRRLDLASLASVRAFARDWDGPLHLLVNNAGTSSPELTRTADGFELAFGTNHLGHFALTNLLLPHITGRVVTVGSQAERMGGIDLDDPNFERRHYRQMDAYNQSKLANILFTTELQRRLTAAGSSVVAHTAHPGLVATNIYAGGGLATRAMVRLLAQRPAAGALPILYAATADLPGDSFTGPRHLMHLRGGAQVIKRSKTAQDVGLAGDLWDLSERLTGVTYPGAD